ncbi:YezD family protein [Bacillus cihuensis]|uniref:YezD family protein n=1 Tax=Bacillus cihuensis TaxID=1208599 RepID=UPI0004198043|nr:YezD family protein [Bacillus cihuensis]
MGSIDEIKLKYIVSSLKNLEFGSLNITVHEGEITQIDVTDKKRFPILKNQKVREQGRI